MSTAILSPANQKAPAAKSSAQDKKQYLPGLNGIRAIASFLIVTSHVDEFTCLFGKKEVGFNATRVGIPAVTIFFVLSGYLITYLLLKEKNKYNSIDFKKFYTRRILRLWPVYYLVVAIALVLTIIGGILPEGRDQLPHLFYYLFFIPNIPFALGGLYSMITPLWSIGVDEQFYIIWPFIISKTQNIAKGILSFIGVYFVIKVVTQYYPPLAQVSLIMAVSRLDCLAIGGLGAYLVLNNHKLLKVVYNKYLQIACWLILLYSTVVSTFHVFTLIDQELYSLLFLVLIVNVSSNPKPIISLENRPMNFIGRITYGLQLYHLGVVFLLAHFFRHTLDGVGNLASFFIIYGATLLLAIPIAHLSYEHFEKRFLRLKRSYTKVPSTTKEDGAGTSQAATESDEMQTQPAPSVYTASMGLEATPT